MITRYALVALIVAATTGCATSAGGPSTTMSGASFRSSSSIRRISLNVGPGALSLATIAKASWGMRPNSREGATLTDTEFLRAYNAAVADGQLSDEEATFLANLERISRNSSERYLLIDLGNRIRRDIAANRWHVFTGSSPKRLRLTMRGSESSFRGIELAPGPASKRPQPRETGRRVSTTRTQRTRMLMYQTMTGVVRGRYFSFSGRARFSPFSRYTSTCAKGSVFFHLSSRVASEVTLYHCEQLGQAAAVYLLRKRALTRMIRRPFNYSIGRAGKIVWLIKDSQRTSYRPSRKLRDIVRETARRYNRISSTRRQDMLALLRSFRKRRGSGQPSGTVPPNAGNPGQPPPGAPAGIGSSGSDVEELAKLTSDANPGGGTPAPATPVRTPQPQPVSPSRTGSIPQSLPNGAGRFAIPANFRQIAANAPDKKRYRFPGGTMTVRVRGRILPYRVAQILQQTAARKGWQWRANEPFSMPGLAGRRIEFDTGGNPPLRTMSYMFVDARRFYRFSFTTTLSRSNRRLFDAIVRTLRANSN